MEALQSPLAAGYSASTPHLFVFQPSDEPDIDFNFMPRPASLFNPEEVTLAEDIIHHRRSPSYEVESRVPSSYDPVRPASVYSSGDDRDIRNPAASPLAQNSHRASVRRPHVPHSSSSGSNRSDSQRESSPELSSSCSLPRQLPAVAGALVAADAGALVVSDVDIAQVESFFAGHNTQVVVCRALANMYLSSEAGAWQLRYTGIPAVLVDAQNGRAAAAGGPRMQLILAEKGTGFMLWRDAVDARSDYSAPDPRFHTVRVSSPGAAAGGGGGGGGDGANGPRHAQRAGFSYDDVEAARQFQTRFGALCAEHVLGADGDGGAAARLKQRAKKRPPRHRKEDISQPCCFQHVTRVTLLDMDRFYTLQSLVGSPALRRMM